MGCHIDHNVKHFLALWIGLFIATQSTSHGFRVSTDKSEQLNYCLPTEWKRIKVELIRHLETTIRQDLLTFNVVGGPCSKMEYQSSRGL